MRARSESSTRTECRAQAAASASEGKISTSCNTTDPVGSSSTGSARATPLSFVTAACLGLFLTACSPTPLEQGEVGDGRQDQHHDPVGPSGAPPSVILITLDTLRADHLGCYGYFRDTSPAIDALADDAVLFERTISVSGTTLPAHVSLMTSTYPARHGVLSNYHTLDAGDGDSVRTIAQMLQEAGYETAGFTSSGGWKEETGIQVGFDFFHLPTEPWSRAEATTAEVRSWLDRRPRKPIFLWVHYFDPHFPYNAPSPFDSLFETDSELLEYLEETGVPPDQREAATEQNNLYDAEIRYMDFHFGELLKAIEAAGLYDESLIIVAGDHGEGMLQHDVLQHGVIYNEQLTVPLIIKFPRNSGPPAGRHPEMVSLIDVLPTVAAQLDLPLETERFDGIDAFASERSSALAESEHTQRFEGLNIALVRENWKYIFRSEGEDTLFHLPSDPWETRDLVDRHEDVADALKTELIQLVRDNRRRGTKSGSAPEASEELTETLRSLGYVK